MAVLEHEGHDQEMLAAAVLHDMIEDFHDTREELAKEFGEDIAVLVQELTDQAPMEMDNREVRKVCEYERIASISARSQTIKFADLISNTKSIVEHDPGFSKVYLREKAALLKVLTKAYCLLHAMVVAQVPGAYFASKERLRLI